MHIMRLFRLLYLLLETGGLTAHALALRLEVSPRTIYRDIEVLGAAGVPVYCQRGKNGGIRLLPGYSVSRALLSGGEQREILAALQGLQATGAGNLENALSKLAALFSPAGAGESNSWVAVDFSDWGQMSARLFDALKGAVIEKQVVTFRYWGTSGRESARTAEPLQLWFKHRTWYLRAWCRTRQASRLFKLSRIQDLRVLDERFERTFNLADFQDKEAVSAAPQVDIILHIDAASAHGCGMSSRRRTSPGWPTVPSTSGRGSSTSPGCWGTSSPSVMRPRFCGPPGWPQRWPTWRGKFRRFIRYPFFNNPTITSCGECPVSWKIRIL